MSAGGLRAFAATTLAALGASVVVLAAAPAQVTGIPVIPDQLPVIAKASALDPIPADFVAVRDVCTHCHVASQFLDAPRSSDRWEQTYARMVRNGARATPEQIDRIVRYFQRNLTIIDVNTSPWAELGPTLQINDETVQRLVARRAQRRFTSAKELAAFPGLDPVKVRKLGERGLLKF